MLVPSSGEGRLFLSEGWRYLDRWSLLDTWANQEQATHFHWRWDVIWGIIYTYTYIELYLYTGFCAYLGVYKDT